METAARVRAFIEQNFYVAAGTVGDETSLLDTGIVDSTGVLEVIAFIEREFSVRVLDREVVPANLDSIARIAAFIETRTARLAG